MNVNIETYRGVEIIFNTESERFSYSVDMGGWNEKQSYAACKKNIDDYLKENAKFEPFKVRSRYNSTIITIVGIRKDNKFVYDNNGKKVQFNEWSEKDYILYEEKDNVICEEIKNIEANIEKLKNQISEKRKSITTPTLKDIKDKYIIK